MLTFHDLDPRYQVQLLILYSRPKARSLSDLDKLKEAYHTLNHTVDCTLSGPLHLLINLLDEIDRLFGPV